MVERRDYHRLESDQPSTSATPHHQSQPSFERKWSHIDNLDSFFRRVYEYHLRGGLWCMLVGDVGEVVRYAFVVALATALSACVDYDILFGRKLPDRWRPLPFNRTTVPYGEKVTFDDIWVQQCGKGMSYAFILVVFLAAMFGGLLLLKALVYGVEYVEIHRFYRDVLRLRDAELVNNTWEDVMQRVIAAQSVHNFSIQKRNLTELDIYQRILRYDNYMVAMINSGLLPPKKFVPCFGREVAFLSNGLQANIKLLFFFGRPFSPWINYWTLRPDFKSARSPDAIARLTTQLSQVIGLVGLLNAVLSPLVFFWQLLNTFCQYADLLKREPSYFGSRRWSPYGRLFLRHFNELDHELDERLSRAYRPASHYMDLFQSPLLSVFAQHIMFIAGGLLAVLLVLTAYDEDVVQVEHMLTLITLLGVAVAICRACIPDEHRIYCPEFLLSQVLTQVHYMPSAWRTQAHTLAVRDEVAQLFQYKFVFVLEELLSPVVTPLLLLFWLRPRTRQFVQFFHDYTVQVEGIGDLCSFSCLNLQRHGNAAWRHTERDQDEYEFVGRDLAMSGKSKSTHCAALLGKTELSLVNFKANHPNWSPPDAAEQTYLDTLKRRLEQDAPDLVNQTAQFLNNPLLMQESQFMTPDAMPFFTPGLAPSNLQPPSTFAPPSTTTPLLQQSIYRQGAMNASAMASMAASVLFMHNQVARRRALTPAPRSAAYGSLDEFADALSPLMTPYDQQQQNITDDDEDVLTPLDSVAGSMEEPAVAVEIESPPLLDLGTLDLHTYDDDDDRPPGVFAGRDA